MKLLHSLYYSIKKNSILLFFTLITCFIMAGWRYPYFFDGFPDMNIIKMEYRNYYETRFVPDSINMTGNAEQTQKVLDFIDTLNPYTSGDLQLMGVPDASITLYLDNGDKLKIDAYKSIHQAIPITYYNGDQEEWTIHFTSEEIDAFLDWFKTLPNDEVLEAAKERQDQFELEQKMENYGENQSDSLIY